jgi:hypothetical protein
MAIKPTQKSLGTKPVSGGRAYLLFFLLQTLFFFVLKFLGGAY